MSWGFFSDQNDLTYDVLGVDIQGRIDGITLPKKLSQKDLKELAAMKKDIIKAYKEGNFFGFVGAIRWSLRQGLQLDLSLIRQAKVILKKELRELESGLNRPDWTKPRKRIAAIKIELDEMDYALSHKGKGQRGPTYGIFDAKDHPPKGKHNPTSIEDLNEVLSKFEGGDQLQEQIFDGWSPIQKFRQNPETASQSLSLLRDLIKSLLNVRSIEVSETDCQEFKIYLRELEKQLRRLGFSAY